MHGLQGIYMVVSDNNAKWKGEPIPSAEEETKGHWYVTTCCSSVCSVAQHVTTCCSSVCSAVKHVTTCCSSVCSAVEHVTTVRRGTSCVYVYVCVGDV